jgi:CysZ protein
MLKAAFNALAILGDRRCRGVIWLGLLLTCAVFVGLGMAVWWMLAHVSLTQIGWLDKTIDVLGGFAVLVVTFLLFPGVATMMIALFLERIFLAVERTHYPDLGEPRSQSFIEIGVVVFKLTVVTVVINVVMLPLYFIFALGSLLWYPINAYLLGREYFEAVALRRLDPAEARRFWKGHRGRLWVGGLLIAFLFSLPVVNLIAPTLAAAYMLHVFEAIRGKA